MQIVIDIHGSGMAGKAAMRAVQALQVNHPDLEIVSARFVTRDRQLAPILKNGVRNVLIICTPHALHADAIVAGDAAGYDSIIVEKPSCVSLDEIKRLQGISAKVAVCHGYRQTWGIRRLRHAIAEDKLGRIFAIEGRYWQSSIAQRAANSITRDSWKNDQSLSGGLDVLLDLSTHWTDLVFAILGSTPKATSVRMLSALAEHSNQDTHVTLSFDYPSGAFAYASLSKVVHGGGNDLEIHIHGTKGSALWKSQLPDELSFSAGAHTFIERRTTAMRGSGLPAFHGLGWNEGYVEIFYDVFRELQGAEFEPYPTLKENLCVVETLLSNRISPISV